MKCQTSLCYEQVSHGSRFFPIGLHKTVVPSHPSAGEHVRYQLLYYHCHPEFEFFYLSQGECVFLIDGNEYPLQAGEAAFVPANAVHAARRLSSAQDTVFFAAVFSRFLIGDSGSDIYEKYIRPVISGDAVINTVFRREKSWQSEVLELLLEILSQYDHTRCDVPGSCELPIRSCAVCPELTIRSDILKIWQICFSHASTCDGRSRIDPIHRERVRQAMDFIHDHYNEPLRLEDMASAVFMSREYFSRVFKNCTNTSPYAYLTGFRIHRSMELLEQTDLSVTEVAQRCGFAQVSLFNRRFSEAVRCTPTEYRKRQRKN